MGKAGRNESKRIAANSLNGAAVAILAACCIGPAVTRNADVAICVLPVLASTVTHLLALRLASDVEA